jgi:hypothetical protein
MEKEKEKVTMRHNCLIVICDYHDEVYEHPSHQIAVVSIYRISILSHYPHVLVFVQ